jgi:AraC-like DNA-binding protein
VSPSCEVRVRFYPPPAELRRYFTTFYVAEWTVADDGQITDYLLPEWANLRFHSGGLPMTEDLSGRRMGPTAFPVTGPSTQSLRFTIGSSRMWGIGLLPLGWAKFIRANATDYANLAIDGFADPAFASFIPLAQTLFGDTPDEAVELERICAHFLARTDEPVEEESRIVAIHGAMIDPDVSTVGDLVAKLGASQRTIERTCHRAFGFSPKLLLRRQRFMRSLSDFMLDPTLKWIGAIDSHYHDQAQFVRDFRQFVGMSPRQYAGLPKPLIAAVMRERQRIAGSAVQTFDGPAGASVSP